MTLIIYIILVADSLPPLPDLSNLPFPEPPLWIGQTADSVSISGYYGDYYGGEIACLFKRINLTGEYSTISNYTDIKYGTGSISYTLPTPTVWMKSSIRRSVVQKDDIYKGTSPMIEFATINPWSLVYGAIAVDLWDINTLAHTEHRSHVNIVFDRTPYAPHFDIIGLYTNKQFTTRCGSTVHIRNFHLAVTSAFGYGFPSPKAIIRYQTPSLKIESYVRNGHVFTPLRDRDISDSPLKYRMIVPEESLSIAAGLECAVNIPDHRIALSLSYDNWHNRIAAGSDFAVVDIQGLQEYFLRCTLDHHYLLFVFNIDHVFNLDCRWATEDIPFQSRTTIVDTLSLQWSSLLLQVHTEFISTRPGINLSLPSVLLLHPRVDFSHRNLTAFFMVRNITDKRVLLYDGFSTKSRGYMLGLKLQHFF